MNRCIGKNFKYIHRYITERYWLSIFKNFRTQITSLWSEMENKNMLIRRNQPDGRKSRDLQVMSRENDYEVSITKMINKPLVIERVRLTRKTIAVMM